MVAQSELKYTWHVPADSHWLRFYLWLYNADAKSITFCRWFWGSLFSPLVLLLVGIIAPFAWLVIKAKDGVVNWKYERGVRRARAFRKAAEDRVLNPQVVVPPKVKKERVIAPMIAVAIVATLAFVADSAARGVQGVQWTAKKTWKPIDTWFYEPAQQTYYKYTWMDRWVSAAERWVRRGAVYLGYTIAIAFALAVVGAILSLIAWSFYVWQERSLAGMEDAGLIVLTAIGVIAVVIGGVVVIDKWGGPIGDWMEWIYDHALIHVGHFFAHIGHFLYLGYYVTKTRTCPKIEVVE